MRAKLFAIMVFGGLLALTGYALAQQASETASPGAQSDANQIICKPGHPQIGSRLPGPRECHTKFEWDEMARIGRESATDQQARGLQINHPVMPGGG